MENIFTSSTIKNISKQSLVSKVKLNREYLLSNYVKDELNTYRMWIPFESNSDTYQVRYEVNGNKVKEIKESKSGLAVRSLFNNKGAVLIGAGNNGDIENSPASEWRISMNTPLLDSPDTRKRIRMNSGCSIKELVEASQAGSLGREIYAYSDFMYCKHLGKIPNNYMVTLRRFGAPVDDYIGSSGEGKTKQDKQISSQNLQSFGCMITWIGTPGNDMENIFKYAVSMPYKSMQAQWETGSTDADGGNGPLNSIAAAMDPAYRKHYMQGYGGRMFNSYVGKMFGGDKLLGEGRSIIDHQDNKKVYGPIDAIKSTYLRSEEGLKFDQTITLTFEYELRSYDGINGRQAMLDLLSNILNVTYTTGTFWGGGYRGSGMHQNNIFTNLNIFKTSGGITDFWDAIQKDYHDLSGRFTAAQDKAGGGIMGLINMAKAALNTLGGMMIGGMLNKLGRPVRGAANSLLSPAPVGLWHLTVGNPHHPILSLGNMILENTEISHNGPLGLDDFPTGLKVTCTLKHGKPRDIRGIENMYMKGQDRIYYSAEDKVFDMYKYSKQVRSKSGGRTSESISGGEPVIKSVTEVNESGVSMNTATENNTLNIDTAGVNSNVLKKYFGDEEPYSIWFAAKEQDHGANKLKPFPKDTTTDITTPSADNNSNKPNK